MIRLLTFAFIAVAYVRDGALTVPGQRLDDLVKLDSPREHVLTLRLDAGARGIAFTFG